MLCIKPIAVPSKGGTAFPCGQCRSCRINRKRQWQARLLLHAASWPYSAFVTLTYRDPPGGGPPHVLCKRHLQTFFKRLRHEGIVFSYVAVGEYGERTTRAHYHLLLFSSAPFAVSTLTDIWARGSVHVGDVQPESIDYCLAYVLKGSSRRPRPDQRPSEFRLFSRGLGDAGAMAILRDVKDAGLSVVPEGFRVYGKLWPWPRRVRAWFQDNGWEIAKDAATQAVELEAAVLLMQGRSFDSEEWQAFLARRQLDLQALQARRIRAYYKLAHGHERKRNETL